MLELLKKGATDLFRKQNDYTVIIAGIAPHSLSRLGSGREKYNYNIGFSSEENKNYSLGITGYSEDGTLLAGASKLLSILFPSFNTATVTINCPT